MGKRDADPENSWDEGRLPGETRASFSLRAEIHCPYCSATHRDLEEHFGLGDEDVEVDCDERGRTFSLHKHVAVTYSAHPLPNVEAGNQS